MHHRLILSALAFSTLGIPYHSLASDLIISPSVFTGVSYIDYRQEAGLFGTRTFDDFEVSGFAPLLGGGLTISYDPVFFVIRGQHTFEASDDDTLTITSAGFRQDFDLDSEFTRSEISAVAGYDIRSPDILGRSAISLFAGYKIATADIKNDVSEQAGPKILDNIDVDFTYHGPYAGVGFRSPIDSLGGHLQVSTTFSYYFANINLNFRTAAGSGLSSVKDGDSATSLGYAFNVGWAGELTDKLYYKIDLDTSKSDFDTTGDVSDFSETEYRLRVGLEYAINTSLLFGNGR